MKKLEVLGTGCPKCKKLYLLVKQAAEELELDYELVKIENIQDIVAAGVMMTPGLVIDGEIKTSGKVPSLDEIKKLITLEND